MTEPPPAPIILVTVEELRRLFNTGRYWERAQLGEFRQMLRNDRHPSSPRAPEPRCTRSQLVIYYDSNDQEVARVHQYLRRDGSLGASGRPDPKLIIIAGVTYKALDARPLPE